MHLNAILAVHEMEARISWDLYVDLENEHHSSYSSLNCIWKFLPKMLQHKVVEFIPFVKTLRKVALCISRTGILAPAIHKCAVAVAVMKRSHHNISKQDWNRQLLTLASGYAFILPLGIRSSLAASGSHYWSGKQ